MADFVLPSLGADMVRGTLVEWLVKPGQRVERGDLIAVIETDKGAIEVEVWTPGVVEALLVEEGTDAGVGTVLARIREDDADDARAPGAEPSPTASRPGPPTPVTPPPPVPPPPVPVAPPTDAGARATVPVGPASSGRVLASPWARHLAAERQVDLAAVTGSGPNGAVLGADLPDHAPAPAAAPRSNLDAMRQAVARAMERSKREIPHYYLGSDIDLGAATAWLERTNAALPPPERLLPAALILKAAALAVREVPEVNGFWRDGRFEPSERVHLGVAVSLRGGGLVAPALHDVDRLALGDLMRALSELVARARRGRLRGSEMTDATLTITALGERGVDQVFGVIYPPQVAIVGVGRVDVRPRVVDGQIVPRPVVSASLAGDHRAHDGHRGGLYLRAFADLLQTPEAL